MSVNKESTYRLAIYKFGSCLHISSAKPNESVIVYSITGKGSRNFASLKMSVNS